MTNLSSTSTEQPASETNRLLISAAIALGIGNAGFFDGIIFHQLLQWHHMFSSVKTDMTVAGLELNTIGDGLFHLFSWLMVAIGTVLLWRASKSQTYLSTRLLMGGLLLGAGLFNTIEGLIDHHILQIHHVHYGPYQSIYDFSFLAIGLILAGWGIGLLRSAQGQVTQKSQ